VPHEDAMGHDMILAIDPVAHGSLVHFEVLVLHGACNKENLTGELELIEDVVLDIFLLIFI
jgi:hypothetical protein